MTIQIGLVVGQYRLGTRIGSCFSSVVDSPVDKLIVMCAEFSSDLSSIQKETIAYVENL